MSVLHCSAFSVLIVSNVFNPVYWRLLPSYIYYEEREIGSKQTLFTVNIDIVRYNFQDETQPSQLFLNFTSVRVVHFPSIYCSILWDNFHFCGVWLSGLRRYNGMTRLSIQTLLSAPPGFRTYLLVILRLKMNESEAINVLVVRLSPWQWPKVAYEQLNTIKK